MVRRRLRRARDPLDLCSIRAIRAASPWRPRCGGVWETRDGGATWQLAGRGLRAAYMPPEQADNQAIQDAHRMVRCAAAPDHFWIQHHNGVFRAVDGIAEWTALQPPLSGFGFAVGVHPHDPATAWLVPAVKDEYRYPVDGRLVVTRTRDGGRSFDTLTEGLPQTDAYDLVYRHGLDVDGTGDRLAVGLDHRRPLVQRGRRRSLAAIARAAAAGLCGAIRVMPPRDILRQ